MVKVSRHGTAYEDLTHRIYPGTLVGTSLVIAVKLHTPYTRTTWVLLMQSDSSLRRYMVGRNTAGSWNLNHPFDFVLDEPGEWYDTRWEFIGDGDEAQGQRWL